MPDSAYTQVQLAVKIAERSAWKPESVRAVENARKTWHDHIAGLFYLADDFAVADAVARRTRKSIDKWPRLDREEFEFYAQLRIYNLLTQLLLRLKYNPASLTPKFWSRLRFELWDNKFWLRDHPSGPVPDFVAQSVARVLGESGGDA